MVDENAANPRTWSETTSPARTPEQRAVDAPDTGAAPADPSAPATVGDVSAIGERMTELRDLVALRLSDDQQRQRMYDELYRQLEFARKGLTEEYLAPIVRELLLVIDRLDAVAGAQPSVASGAGAGDEIASVRAELAEVLVRRGLRQVDAVGEAFDPRVHEAVGRLDDPERVGQVVEVRRPGYALGDRLIRPAQVVVGYDGSARTR